MEERLHRGALVQVYPRGFAQMPRQRREQKAGEAHEEKADPPTNDLPEHATEDQPYSPSDEHADVEQPQNAGALPQRKGIAQHRVRRRRIGRLTDAHCRSCPQQRHKVGSQPGEKCRGAPEQHPQRNDVTTTPAIGEHAKRHRRQGMNQHEGRTQQPKLKI
jgi:hypothetical protein